MKIEPKIAAATAELTAIRRDIHAHPELGFEEERTSEIVAKKLKEWGCEVTTGIGKTGVVGTIRVGNNPRAIGLRADMDALPMDEHNTFDHRSQNKGRMHACGHDGHTTMLLGAAKYLSATRNFDGTVHLIFQPAEEGRGGAEAMVKDGLFEKFPCEQIFGMHNRPKLDVGKFAIRSGPQMAGGGLFDIHITGKGAHGARPESGIDPVIIATQIISALQSVVSRNVAALDSAVISVTQMHAGDAYNVIPQEAVLRGTIRAFRKETMALVKERIETISKGIAQTLGGKAEPDVRVVFPPLVNNKDAVKFIADVAAEIVGEDNMNREGPYVMASEDFSYMLEKVPGAFINIGNGGGEGGCEVHNPGYDFNDDIITLGATLWSRVVERKLVKDAGFKGARDDARRSAAVGRRKRLAAEGPALCGDAGAGTGRHRAHGLPGPDHLLLLDGAGADLRPDQRHIGLGPARYGGRAPAARRHAGAALARLRGIDVADVPAAGARHRERQRHQPHPADPAGARHVRRRRACQGLACLHGRRVPRSVGAGGGVDPGIRGVADGRRGVGGRGRRRLLVDVASREQARVIRRERLDGKGVKRRAARR